MKDYSLPPYDIDEIGAKVAELCKEYGVNRTLGIPNGYYGEPFISEALAEIADKNGLKFTPTGDIGISGVQLQRLLIHLGKLKA